MQSSIISTTTDGVSQLDWRSIRRHRTTPSTSHLLAAPRGARHLVDTSRPTSPSTLATSAADVQRPKRKYCRRATTTQDLVYGLGASYVGGSRLAVTKPSHQRVAAGRKGRPPSLDSRGRQAATNARKRPAPSQHTEYPCDGKNYVKIPGHYQDDFVYYATKRARGRPRKDSTATALPQTSSTPGHTRSTGTVGGINVFDWYREMAQTDKVRSYC